MRAKLLIAVFACALGAFGGWLVARQPAPTNTRKQLEPAALALVPPEPLPFTPPVAPSAARCTLGEIYTTFKHPNLKLLPPALNETNRRATAKLTDALDSSGAATCFLVSAPDIYAALGATARVLFDREPAHQVDPNDPFTAEDSVGPNRLWLFAFLGPACDADHWALKEVVVDDKAIVLRCARADTTVASRSGETTGQAFWCPLPPLAPGEYHAVVRDGESPVPLAARRVTVRKR